MDTTARYQANLAYLAAQQPALAATFAELVLTNVRLYPAAHGALTGAGFEVSQQAWVPLAAQDDPVAEAERDADTLYTPGVKVFCLLGLGLGYFTAALQRRLKPYQRLAVFEPDPVLFKATLYALDIPPLLDDGRIQVFVGDGCVPALEHFYLSRETHEKLFLAPPMRAGYTTVLHAQAYEALQATCLDLLRYHGVGLATWSQFGRHIGDNDLANLPEYCTMPGLQALDKGWEGRPAVCLAAGPSLRYNVRQLADPAIRARVALLTVGTMYHLVRQLGLAPDLVTGIDFQRLTYTDQFQHLPLDPRTALVYLHSITPDVPRRWPGPAFVARNASDTTEWLKTFCEDKGAAGQVQTVAHLNLLTAYALGADPIILLGQDLSQPADWHHAPGARAQDTLVGEAPDSHVAAVDIYGQPCWTRHSYLSMRTVFAHLIAQHPGVRVVNCTEGGLAIDGLEQRPLAAVLDELRASRPAPRRLAEVAAERFQAYTPQAEWPRLTAELEALPRECAALVARCRTLLAETDDWGPPTEDAEVLLTPARTEAITRLATTELATHQLAFASFAVRRFELVVELSQIPPVDVTPAHLQAMTVQRWRRLATVIVDEWPRLASTLRQLQGRLADVHTAGALRDGREGFALLRRQSYRVLEARLRHPLSLPALGTEAWAGLWGYLALARGQYAEARPWFTLVATPWAAAAARYAARRLEASEASCLTHVAPYLAASPPASAPALPESGSLDQAGG